MQLQNPQKNYSASQVQMDQTRYIATQNMPNNINKRQTGWKYSQNMSWNETSFYKMSNKISFLPAPIKKEQKQAKPW